MKKGFTLIELLAVIVILAIIALIATPIVLNIINETKESAGLRSTEFYLDAVEHTIANEIINGNLENKEYPIASNGNLCKIELEENGTCLEGNELKVEIKGEKPSSGRITITSGKIKGATIILNDKIIEKTNDGKLVYADTELKYTIGESVTFNPGDGDRVWNVIGEDVTTVTLMLKENLGETVAWYKYSNHNTYDNSYGPKDALDYLNSLTTEWDNVEPIGNYTYINNLNGTTKPYGHQKIEIKNGVTTLTHKDGAIITNVVGETKARLLSVEEMFEIAQKTNTNLTEENLRAFIERNLATVNAGLGTSLTTVDEGISFMTELEGSEWLQYETKYMQTYYTVLGMINKYSIETTYDILLPDYLYQNLYSDKSPSAYLTLSSSASLSYSAWNVNCYSSVGYDYVHFEEFYGVRPVITISKSKLFK